MNKIMKISVLQKIIEYYKQRNGDLEVRLVIDTHNGREYNELSCNCIDVTQVYNKEDFIREVQMTIKANIDGHAGPQTLSRTVSVSSSINKTHNVVYPLQKFFKNYGYYTKALDKKCGPGMTEAINRYQKEVLKYLKVDGKITAKGKMWKSLLGLL